MDKSKTFLDLSEKFDDLGIVAGFTYRTFNRKNNDNRHEFALALGLNPEQLVIPVQVHSNNVAICDNPGIYPTTDALVTDNNKLVLSIQVADCIPIYFVDKSTKNIALVHAGWRGIVNGIILNTITSLTKIGSETRDLLVYLGPSIRKNNFEIGLEILNMFQTQFIHRRDKDKIFVDLQGLAISQMTNRGIPKHQIFDSGECTFQNRAKYYSYRRDGQKAGRMIAMLGLK